MIHKQIMRYLIGGVSVFLFSIGLLYIFVDILGVWYLWATTMAFILSLGMSFTVQKYWTFRDHSTDGLTGQMGAYAFLQVFNLAANGSLMFIAVGKIGIPHLVAQVGTTATIAIWSFLAYRYLFTRPT